jgi:anti-sigma B factor antagonist
MNVNHNQTDNTQIFSITGKVDTLTAPELDHYFKQHIDFNQTEVVIDGQALTYISSSGLRVLLLLAKQAKANQKSIVLQNLNESVRQVFTISGFDSLFVMK